VNKAVIGDKLRVRVVQETAEFRRAEIVEILEAGEKRVSAPCPHFFECGGCSLQQMEQSYYQEFKTKIVQNAFRQAGFADVNPKMFFLPAASRRRAEFKLLAVGNKYSLAYMGNRSHNKVAIDNCLILEENLQKLLPTIIQKINKLPFVSEIENVSITSADKGIEVLLQLQNRQFKALDIPEASAPFMVFDNVEIPLPYDAFLQATREGARLLSKFAKHETRGSKKILDLFCGIGAYSIPMAEFASVTAVDDHEMMIENLKIAVKGKNLGITAEKRNLFTKPFAPYELAKFDGIVLNPPRSGAKAQVEQIASMKPEQMPKNLVLISCNPATFARDAKTLKNAGFTLKNSIAIDQFVYSPHLEIAASFGRI